MEKNFWQRNKVVLIILAVIVLLALWVVGKYNSFVRQNEAITNQWAQVDNQLQRRFDLIPNVVNTVKGITKQEKDVFTAIADARTHYAGASTVDQKATAAGQVESSLGRLLVITENYPQLLSSKSFQDLTVELEGAENRIAVERMKYNDLVKSLNAGVKVFPSSIVASIFGVKERAYFEVKDEAKVVPKVDFTQ
ncbi:LemA family protein [Candidatus Nomurabacteria bacterium]|nr:LemA family protein [Candidatus Nomurabacteria bacterium]